MYTIPFHWSGTLQSNEVRLCYWNNTKVFSHYLPSYTQTYATKAKVLIWFSEVPHCKMQQWDLHYWITNHLRESKSVNLSLAVFFFVTCYAIPVVHNISLNLNSTLLILCEFMITLKYYINPLSTVWTYHGPT